MPVVTNPLQAARRETETPQLRNEDSIMLLLRWMDNDTELSGMKGVCEDVGLGWGL